MNTNFDINVEIERLSKLCASKSIDNNTLLADMKKIKKNKDVTTIYKYGFNSLQDAVALAKVILRKKEAPPKSNLWCLTQMNPLMLHLWKLILINKSI